MKTLREILEELAISMEYNQPVDLNYRKEVVNKYHSQIQSLIPKKKILHRPYKLPNGDISSSDTIYEMGYNQAIQDMEERFK